MAENLIITEGDKEQQYQTLFPQIEALLAGETDMTANMANVAAALKQTFDFFWVGFYVVKEDMLVLRPDLHRSYPVWRDAAERAGDG